MAIDVAPAKGRRPRLILEHPEAPSKYNSCRENAFVYISNVSIVPIIILSARCNVIGGVQPARPWRAAGHYIQGGGKCEQFVHAPTARPTHQARRPCDDSRQRSCRRRDSLQHERTAVAWGTYVVAQRIGPTLPALAQTDYVNVCTATMKMINSPEDCMLERPYADVTVFSI